MCLSCGCKQPNEDHGDQRNITLQDLQDAAQASEIGAQEVVRNIQSGFQEFGQGQAGAAGPQSASGGYESGGTNRPQ